MTKAVKTHIQNAVLEVTLDRPKANAVDLATSRELGEVFADFRDNPDLRVAIVTAAGDKFFCPGWDLKAADEGEMRLTATMVWVVLVVCKNYRV